MVPPSPAVLIDELGLPAVYGVDIDLYEFLPIVDTALEWLNSNHLKNEGIWRTSGSKKEISKLQAVTDEMHGFPIHEIQKSEIMTGLLTRFLEEMPGGLIDADTTEDVLSFYSTSSDVTRKQLTDNITRTLSIKKRQLFSAFVNHWQQVVATKENLMDAKGVATCVFPVVFPSKMDLTLVEILATIFETDEVQKATGEEESKSDRVDVKSMTDEEILAKVMAGEM